MASNRIQIQINFIEPELNAQAVWSVVHSLQENFLMSENSNYQEFYRAVQRSKIKQMIMMIDNGQDFEFLDDVCIKMAARTRKTKSLLFLVEKYIEKHGFEYCLTHPIKELREIACKLMSKE